MIFAYIDPGTGSLLVQALLGGIAGLAVYLKTTGRRLFRRTPKVETETPADI
ncbi:MAG: hypothetical protein LC739_11560 [Actinobacteria bacterium]|nr:hypothetical protein [Acidimicrobiia bacterium]MCA1736707.1 hypothetical protein [Actinomycetota bacterium]MDQ3501057.1 hypothetical protein [Actinomycetota bacterium]